MTELKTLKDLVEYRACPDYEESYYLDNKNDYDEYNGDKEIVVDNDTLRNSVIKWIKEFDSNIIRYGGLNDRDCPYCARRLDMPGNPEKLHTIAWIKHFFNIEDKDLK